MKHILYTIALVVIAAIYVSCNDEDYSVQRLSAPQEFSATKGDTSVFLKWKKVEGASFYTLVRGLKVIADSLHTESYEDGLGPDTLTEYRIYAVNDQGWRSNTYAADSGYLGITPGLLPRTPVRINATASIQGCLLTWQNGRFATSYEVFKNGVLYKKVTKWEFLDYDASTSTNEYKVYSVNSNGKSVDGIAVTGRKAYVCLDTYESYSAGKVIDPWTDLPLDPERTKYYTEGSPTVSPAKYYEGVHSLEIKSGKVQILHDWGGARYEGEYVICFMAYKESGSFNVYSDPNFVNESHDGTSKWVSHSFSTGLKKVGEKFNITIESKGDEIPMYIDNVSIEYQYKE